MSGQETGGQELRERIKAAVEAWFDSPDDLAGNDEMAGQVTDVVMRRVQPRLDEQAAENERLRSQLDDATSALADARLEAEGAEIAWEAERDRLRAAEKRVRELHSADQWGDCKGCGLTAYEEATPWTDCDTIAALDQSDGQETT